MTQKYFITATGTDQGKTLVTAALCWQLRQAGLTVKALKPVISGYQPEGLFTDTSLLLQSMEMELNEQNIQAISPWRFTAPLSVDEAARRENKALKIEDIVAFCEQPAKEDIVLIEGAGGLMSPLSVTSTNLNLIKALKSPAILVSASYLGCISHILTSLKVLESENCTVAAIVISQVKQQELPLEVVINSLRSHVPSTLPLLQVKHLVSQDEIWKNAGNMAQELGIVGND